MREGLYKDWKLEQNQQIMTKWYEGKMKTLEDLMNREEPGWHFVQTWLAHSKNHCEILPKDRRRAELELVNAQITPRSPMGAVIYETGGIFVDYGWIRILGSGSPRLDRGLMEWNRGKTFELHGDRPEYLLVADDVIGGLFAINAGGLGNEMGGIYYFATDTLEWESFGCGYADFLNWTLNGDVLKFYESFRWKKWREDVRVLNGLQMTSFYPFLWAKYENIEDLHRGVISVEENYWLMMEIEKQLGGND
jgi:hypothetical protein